MSTGLQVYNSTLHPNMCPNPLWPIPEPLTANLPTFSPEAVSGTDCGISDIDILSHLARHIFTLPCTFKNNQAYECPSTIMFGMLMEAIKRIEVLPSSPFDLKQIFIKAIFSDLRRIQFELTAVSCYMGNVYLCITGIVTGAFINRDLIKIIIQNGIEWHHRKECKTYYSNFPNPKKL